METNPVRKSARGRLKVKKEKFLGGKGFGPEQVRENPATGGGT